MNRPDQQYRELWVLIDNEVYRDFNLTNGLKFGKVIFPCLEYLCSQALVLAGQDGPLVVTAQADPDLEQVCQLIEQGTVPQGLFDGMLLRMAMDVLLSFLRQQARDPAVLDKGAAWLAQLIKKN